MGKYSQQELNNREKIFQTHKYIIEFMDKYTLNNLINLFDISNNDNIVKYIENERRKRGLDSSNVSFQSEIYGENVNNSTLFFMIKKNGNDYLHLTIHLSIKSLNPKRDGIIHMKKNYYKEKNNYALILISKLNNKPDSLVFSIANGYNTPDIKNAQIYDPEIQKEMDVIIHVLNRIFDEEDEIYVGKMNRLITTHNKIPLILKNINRHSKYATRKNKGSTILQKLKNIYIYSTYRQSRKTYRKPRNRTKKYINNNNLFPYEINKNKNYNEIEI
jgi:hypothetical protein